MNPLPEPAELIARYADGGIDATELRVLEQALRADAGLRRHFLEFTNLDAALADAAALSGGTAAPRTGRRWALAAAAAVVIISGALWLSRGVPATVTSSVVAGHGARLAGREDEVRTGETLNLSKLDLTSGWLRLRLSEGLTLDLHAPLQGELIDGGRIRLVRGRLLADVGEAARPFAVLTHAAEISDYGTRYAVDVAGDGEAAVAVFDGNVRVRPRASGEIRLGEGEGLRVRAGSEPRRLYAVPVDGAPGSPPLVAGVRDNVTDPDFRRYYGLSLGGMREGARMHTTMPRARYRACEGEPFPEELLGADIVQTYHADRRERDLEITLDLARPATVYVMYDTRAVVPTWLTEAFEPTAMRVRSGPWNAVKAVADIEPDRTGEIYVTYRVWRKRVADPGPVLLGAREDLRRGAPRVMYGIAVKP